MKKLVAFLLSFLPCVAAISCTTFCINRNGHIVFGRNYDWVTGEGIVYTNLRGLLKSSTINLTTTPSNEISWVSKYGSITFNQYGKEFPMGGMNEKGLVVELMWLDDTKYPQPDNRPALNVLQWVQYQLDNASSVTEVISSDKKLRIDHHDTPLHYLVADAAGDVATIEFLDGKMIVHSGNTLPFPVLTNSTYSQSSQVTNTYIGNNQSASALDNSLERFVTACRMVKKVSTIPASQSLNDYAFTILKEVSQGDFTRWSIVYDITNKTIAFKTRSHPTIKTISLSSFDYACTTTPAMFNMNQRHTGNIAPFFTRPDNGLSKRVLEKAIAESSSRVTITDHEKDDVLNYASRIKCQ